MRSALVSIDREKFELSVIVHAIFLREYEDETPEVADQPCINRIVSLVRCNKNLGHDWQQALQRKLLEVQEKLVLVDIENLEASEGWILLNHLVSNIHGFVIRMAYAGFNILQVETLLPFDEPLSFGI